jgi:hypothetical protein
MRALLCSGPCVKGSKQARGSLGCNSGKDCCTNDDLLYALHCCDKHGVQ